MRFKHFIFIIIGCIIFPSFISGDSTVIKDYSESPLLTDDKHYSFVQAYSLPNTYSDIKKKKEWIVPSRLTHQNSSFFTFIDKKTTTKDIHLQFYLTPVFYEGNYLASHMI
ncbi:hypothetical protein BACCIP111883_02375 [Sutcliffiella rhizosphaerae]|uniref:Uncharacterized protein n=1 Tax=Sutcliffiella rhizosphaerae TaxID=2880967 RepID=A0ABM8YNZ5_9BACI|nr:hypothetical protein BACCIP111883_02375 [Sutcliffiella rhizosphaerae]